MVKLQVGREVASSWEELLAEVSHCVSKALSSVLRPLQPSGRESHNQAVLGEPQLRAVELRVQLYHDEDPAVAAEVLAEALPHITHVVRSPQPAVEMQRFNLLGAVLVVRVYTEPHHYWKVFVQLSDVVGLVGSPQTLRRIRIPL